MKKTTPNSKVRTGIEPMLATSIAEELCEPIALRCFLTIKVVEVRLELSEFFCNPLFALTPDVLLTIKVVEIDR